MDKQQNMNDDIKATEDDSTNAADFSDNSKFSINGFFNNLPIRIIGTHDEPIFYAMDIANVLGMKRVASSIKGFDETEIVTPKLRERLGLITYRRFKSGARRDDKVILLTEFGTYRLILNSRTELATQFKAFVYNTIRKLRLDEQEKLKVEHASDIESLSKKEQELASRIEEYQKYNPAVYVFRKKIDDNPYNHMLEDEIERKYKESKTSHLMKYTINPRPEDFTQYTLYAKLFGDSIEIMSELDKDCLDANEKSSKYCAYYAADDLEECTSNFRVKIC